MTDKPINICEFFTICETECSGIPEDTKICKYYELYEQLHRYKQVVKEIEDISKYCLQQDRCKLCKNVDKCRYDYTEFSWNVANLIIQKCEELKSHVLTRCPECNSEYLSPVGVELYDENKQLKADKEQTEQKLEKIRQVVKSCIKGDVAKIRMEQILQIIDEVE